jgi:peptidoglycan-associated lipoprotein
MLQSRESVLKAVCAFTLLASLAACAEKPKPVSMMPPPPRAMAVPPAQSSNPVTEQHLPGIVAGSQQDFVVNVGDRIYFDTDHSDIRADAQGVLAAQAAWLVRYPAVMVRIEGNADERGTREYNYALGARRAQSVKDFLVSRGVLPSRIATISYGKENPIDPGSDEASWAKNRNAHTAIVSGAR